MDKILKLYINEMFKLSRKASTIILLVLMIIGCFLLPLFIKVNQQLFLDNGSSFYEESSSLEQQKKASENRIAEIENEITALEGSADADMQIYSLQMEMVSAKAEIEKIDLMLENNITGNKKDGFVYDAVGYIPVLRGFLADLATVSEEDRDADWEAKNALYEEGIALAYSSVETKDFKAFIDFEQRYYQTNPYGTFNEAILQQLIEQTDLWYRLDPSGGTDGKHDYNDIWAVIYTLTEMKYELDSGVTTEQTMSSTRYTALSPKREADLKDRIAVLEYRIGNNSLVLASESPLWNLAKSYSAGLGQFLINILLLVIAGSAISQEIATGSIKSLIIAPVRRWKIFTAKLLSLFTTGVIAVVILCIFSNIGASVFMGTDAMVPYVYVSGDTVHSMPYWLYDLLNLFAGNISTIVYCTFAFILSIITRNTALSVGVSIATLFSTGIAAQFLDSMPFPHQLWMDFLPFMNFDLAGDLFPFSSLMEPLDSMMTSYGMTIIRPTLQFSIIYLIVLLFCMLYIGFDSFTRKDIK